MPRLSSGESRRRFQREARACARLRHHHIVTVHDYGTTGHDVAYIVMERLAGIGLLRTLLNHRGIRGAQRCSPTGAPRCSTALATRTPLAWFIAI